jgi:hypothetical protein
MMRHRMCYSTAARKGRQAEAPTAGERQPPAVPSGAVRVDPDTAGQPVEKDMWEVKLRAVTMLQAHAHTEQRAPVTENHPPAPLRAQGEQFEALGQLSSYFIPLLAVLALLVGLFASSTYDEVRCAGQRHVACLSCQPVSTCCCVAWVQGATVFLDAPKSAEDSAKLVPAVQLQRE